MIKKFVTSQLKPQGLAQRQAHQRIGWFLWLIAGVSLIELSILSRHPVVLAQFPSLDLASPMLAAIPFKPVTVDAAPNMGVTCCVDVLAVGDLNRDGRPDIVLGSEGATADGLVWYAGPDWRRYAIGQGDFSTDGEVADLDGDGDQDIVISSISRNNIEWWENLGVPEEQSSWTLHHLGPGFAHDLAIADLNADGKLDVVVKQIGNSPLLWFEQPAEPTVPWSAHQIDSFDGEGLALGDLDNDGDLDIAVSQLWYENQRGDGTLWQRQPVAAGWRPDTRIALADLNDDGRLDLVLSSSESLERLSWFQNPSWQEHPITAGLLDGAHSLEVGDLDNDGDLDIFTGEMHTSWRRRLLIFRNQGDGLHWQPVILARTGTHNARVADLDGDGDLDIIGKNYAGAHHEVVLWQNLSANLTSQAQWRYLQVDGQRPATQFGKMGLVFADVNHDLQTDIVAGSYLYFNPGDLDRPWLRQQLPADVDTFFQQTIDDDDQVDLIGIAGNQLLWLEATSPQATGWATQTIGLLPDGRTQGYVKTQIVAGGQLELVFTHGQHLYFLQIPQRPSAAPWPLVEISDQAAEEGIAAGDLDGDGDPDLVAITGDGHHVRWFANPGDGSGGWPSQAVGEASEWLDRIALVDLNGDDRLDILTSEELRNGQFQARLTWFAAPANPASDEWASRTIDTLRSINSMETADLDQDNDLDIIVAEHTDQRRRNLVRDNLTLWYENQQAGQQWIMHIIEIGPHSSHLGVRSHDLDNDGDLDLVSLAWRQYRQLHLWRNLSAEQADH